MALFHKIYRLKGVVQHYSWGGYDFIPELLNQKNTERKPYAEYWLGAHLNHPSVTEEGYLNELVQNDPSGILGKSVAKKFSSLPYLFKVLDVRQMLSIQVHPSKQFAKKGYENENKKRVALNAFNRNYKDENHKPELMVALSDFWLLHGFKEERKLKNILQQIPELNFLEKIFAEKKYKGIYEKVMLMDQQEVNEVLKPLAKRILPLYQTNQLQKNQEDFWAAKAALHFCKDENYDRGIFSVYFFNLLHLQKGEGIFQPAGLPHAYLEGQNVEVMANSDNVLRAGLTDKYIDVPELMKHVQFEETIPVILKKGKKKHTLFSVAAEEFELHEYCLNKNDREKINASSAEIWLLMNGRIEIVVGEQTIILKKGEAVFIAASGKALIEAISDSNLFRVAVP